MLKLLLRISVLLYILVLQVSISFAQISSKPCPYDCDSADISRRECRDWRVGNKCFVEQLSPNAPAMVVCVKNSDGSVRVRSACKADGSEKRVDIGALTGATGPQGPKGDQGDTGAQGIQGIQGVQGIQGTQGIQGASGADGMLRVYGDGSAGSKVFSSNTIFTDSNPQYTNVTIQPGVTLTVPSGTIIRCTGTFQNNGTITIQSGLRDAARFGENGRIENSASSSGVVSPGGAGGAALPSGVAKSLIRPGLVAGGNGYRQIGDVNGDGGGTLTVICADGVTNNGLIQSNGSNASLVYRGGGGGGFVVLASATSVSNTGTIRANGGDGGAFEATNTDFTGHGPAGGGGGGLVHLIAPSIGSTGTIEVDGGNGGVGGGAGTITGIAYLGGGGGGGAGGAGGDGGAVNPGNIGNGSANSGASGAAGQIIQTLADPVSLF